MLAHPDRRFDPGRRGEMLTLLTVITAYIAGFIAIGAEIDLGTWALLILLGLVHISLGIFGERIFFHPATSA